jgi:hypothetical protein
MDIYILVLYLCLILVVGTVLFMSFVLLFLHFSLYFYTFFYIVDHQRLIVPNVVLETPATYIY